MRIRIAPAVTAIPADGGAPQIPTSKSHAQRALCVAHYLATAGIAPDLSIAALPDSGDVRGLQAALQNAHTPDAVLDLRDNGTALRILSVLPPLLGEACTLDGGKRLRERPLTASVEFLRTYGASAADGWPRVFDGRGVEWPDELVVDAQVTTQTATGVLLGAALRRVRNGQQHCVRVRRPAAPDYLSVTLEVLGWFGFAASSYWEQDDFIVEFHDFEPPPPGHVVTIPVDPSSYSFFAAFMALHGKETGQFALHQDSHPDWLFGDDLDRLLRATPNQEMEFSELRRRPDTFPCLAAVAALRCGRTVFTGIPALRYKESDRIHAMAEGLLALGVRCDERPDGLVVEGPMPTHDAPVYLPTPDDHRVVMALALLGTRVPGGVEIDNPEAVQKSWPGYFDWLARVSEVTWL